MSIRAGILKGLVLCSALMALVFLFVVPPLWGEPRSEGGSRVEPFIQNTVRPYSILSSLGLLGHTSSPDLIAPTSSELFLLPTSTGMRSHTTAFAEENSVVFSEFIAPSEGATSTIQNILAMPTSSSILMFTSSTEAVVSSTLPVDVTPPLVINSATATPEIWVFTVGAGTPVNIKIEPTLCAITSSTPSRVARINELAWMGTVNSFTDEWVELYNTSSSSLSLAGVQLVASSSKSLFSVRFDGNDTIPANGYFLLERTNDTSVPNLTADKIYTGALNDDDEVVELFDVGCNSLDRIDFKKDFPAISINIDRRSMELKQDGTFALYEGDIDATSGIFGSPKRENSNFILETTSSTVEVVASSTEIIEVVPQISNVSSTPRVVINEILFDGVGSDKGKEFVELYNLSDIDQDLKGWSLRLLKTGATSTTSLAVFGDNSSDVVIIPQRGFLLVGLNSYDAANFNTITADVRRSNVLPNGEDEASILLFDANKNEVDPVVYTASSIAIEGQSLQRSEIGIFVISDVPSPQNTFFAP
ncbi:MAG: lamin tail domain-containing protein [Patescibacteria group bacterium]